MSMVNIIIPNRMDELPTMTLSSLAKQAFTDISICVAFDHGRGASWARNDGFKNMVPSRYTMFADNDNYYRPDAIAELVSSIEANPDVAFVYGQFVLDGKPICVKPFDKDVLCSPSGHDCRISTSCVLMRSECFPGFDESLVRFQDWDLWINMARLGYCGLCLNTVLYETKSRRNGISFDGRPESIQPHIDVLRRKWNF